MLLQKPHHWLKFPAKQDFAEDDWKLDTSSFDKYYKDEDSTPDSQRHVLMLNDSLDASDQFHPSMELLSDLSNLGQDEWLPLPQSKIVQSLPVETSQPTPLPSLPIQEPQTEVAVSEDEEFQQAEDTASSEEINEEEEEFLQTSDEDVTESSSFRKYPQPSSFNADKLTIGTWVQFGFPFANLQSIENVDVKFLYGRRKVKYEFRHRSSKCAISFDFSQISTFHVDSHFRTITIDLSSPPNSLQKPTAQWLRGGDFTQGNIFQIRRHVIRCHGEGVRLAIGRLLQSDSHLRSLSTKPLSQSPANPVLAFPTELRCEWDSDRMATLHCESCHANFCDECDEILHRHPQKKNHIREPCGSLKLKKRKRSKKDRCRCGTGATKGTLGSPCTGNRCPCFGEGRQCVGCGCKNCHNPQNALEEESESHL